MRGRRRPALARRCRGACTSAFLAALVACRGCAPAGDAPPAGNPQQPAGQAAGPPPAGRAANDLELAASSPPDQAEVIPIASPTAAEPVAWAAAIVPQEATPGGEVMFVLRARTAPGWYIHAADKPAGGVMPTELKLRLPSGVEPVGDWQLPKPVTHVGQLGAQRVYQGDLIFRRLLKLAGSQLPGPLEVVCTVSFQACDENVCLRPETLELSVPLNVVSPAESSIGSAKYRVLLSLQERRDFDG